VQCTVRRLLLDCNSADIVMDYRMDGKEFGFVSWKGQVKFIYFFFFFFQKCPDWL
jgi:hypothetical protein